jgi:hypothetical protein
MTKKLFLERAKIQGFRVIIILGHLDRWVPSVAQRRDLRRSPKEILEILGDLRDLRRLEGYTFLCITSISTKRAVVT